jgi:CRISPR/Cas system CSM-associated protein Csm3 (group 7 of RAMP superfamily)
METKEITVTIHSYWHIGSGYGRGADVDAEVLKKDGLPFIPGRTLKGLLREGLQVAEDAKIVKDGTVKKLFGAPAEKGNPDGSTPGILQFSDAEIPADESKWFKSKDGREAAKYLYDTFGSTAINADGTAKEHSLRIIELTVPMTLEARVSSSSHDKEVWGLLAEGFTFVRGLGSHRNRGLGRCTIAWKSASQGGAQ